MTRWFRGRREAWRVWKNGIAKTLHRAATEIKLRRLIFEVRRQLADKHPERLPWFEDLRITRAVFHMEAHPQTEFNRRFLAGYSDELLVSDLNDLEEQIRRLAGMQL